MEAQPGVQPLALYARIFPTQSNQQPCEQLAPQTPLVLQCWWPAAYAYTYPATAPYSPPEADVLQTADIGSTVQQVTLM